MLTSTRTILKYSWPAMGTTWRIYHRGDVPQAAADDVAALVEEDEARWSRFRPDSELSHINRNAGQPVRVSEETFDLLVACQRWTALTDGVFQPLVGTTLRAWGYRESLLATAAGAGHSPSTEPVDGAIELDDRGRTVVVPPGRQLDLGGIAKSWTVARAGRLAAALTSELSLLIDGGGDLLAVRGEHEVIVDLPDEPGGDRIVIGPGTGVATSGTGRRRWRNADGVDAHHLIDPCTGRPGPWTQATVVADDPVAADVLATVLALRPERIGELAWAASVCSETGRTVTEGWETLWVR